MVRVLCFFLAMQIPVSAQIWPEKASPSQIWDGPRLLSVSENAKEIRFEGPGYPEKGRTFQLPEGMRFLAFRNGTYYAFRRTQGEKGREYAVQESQDLKVWSTFGTFRGEMTGFVPLDDGRAFIMSGLEPVHDGQDASHMGLFRRAGGDELLLDALVSFPWSSPLLQPTGSRDSNGRPLREIPAKWSVIQQTFCEAPALMKDHFCVFNRQTGWVLVFDYEKGRLKRTVQVYPSIDEARITKDGSVLEVGILSLQPTVDGDLMLAIRMEDAVLNSRKIFPSGPEKHHPEEDPWEAEKPYLPEQEISATKAWPEILYRRLVPGRGDVLPENPAGMPRKFKSLTHLKRFHIQYRVDGKLEEAP